jgi:Ca2+-transporting ATPase
VAVIYAQLREPPPRACEIRSDLPEAVDSVIAEAMAKKPAERYPTCEALVTAARGALAAPAAATAEVQAVAAELAERGRRVLAVARREGEQPWRLLGLLGLVDPPRPQARETVAGFRRAGVRPVMITGDHPRTARAIAGEVGLADETARNVHARIRPEGKTAIVVELQAAGEIVAMTGDGVNDAPALRAADIGVAMGQRGTQVAQQAADIVLTGDDLSAMLPAIGEGRRVYDNLRRFLHYGLAGGLAEILIMLLGPALGFAMPLRSGQILWVNLLTHGVTGVAMGNEPAAADVAIRPPRPPREHLLNGRTAARVALLGSAITAACIGVAVYGRWADRPWQGMLFFALGFSQLAVALALRPRGRRRGTSGRNRGLLAAVAGNALLAWLAVAWPPLCELLRVPPLALRDLVPGLLAAALAATVARFQVAKVASLDGQRGGASSGTTRTSQSTRSSAEVTVRPSRGGSSAAR